MAKSKHKTYNANNPVYSWRPSKETRSRLEQLQANWGVKKQELMERLVAIALETIEKK
ncbi:MAG TPA: hypothetical protein V6D33_12375 [Cyanophyceae cyanobacterium]